jgi:hypothetical protein
MFVVTVLKSVCVDGFGGLVVSMLAEAVGFLRT